MGDLGGGGGVEGKRDRVWLFLGKGGGKVLSLGEGGLSCFGGEGVRSLMCRFRESLSSSGNLFCIGFLWRAGFCSMAFSLVASPFNFFGRWRGG